MRRHRIVCTFSLAVTTAFAAATLSATAGAAFAQGNGAAQTDQQEQQFKYFLAVRVEPVEGGLLVRELLADGPADRSGLQPGDVLVAPVGGERLKRVEDLNRVVTASD